MFSQSMALSLLGLCLQLATAQSTTMVPFASHCAQVSGGQACFAVNVPATSSDLYFSMTGPSSLGWSGIGFGSQMRNSLYFIAQPTADNVTVSLRTASGEVMPTAYTATPIALQVLNGTTNNGTIWTANFLCTDCRTWSTGSIDVSSSSAAMIWAVGTLGTGASATSATAVLNYHNGNRGNFNLDLVSASGVGGVPGSVLASTADTSASATPSPVVAVTPIATGSVSSGSSSSSSSSVGGGGRIGSYTRLWISHAVLTTVGWILIMGIGAILVRFFPGYFAQPVRVHYMTQIAGTVLVIAGVVLGIVASSGDHFHYAHQTVGVVVFALMFLQAALGSVHHILWKKGQRGKHMVMGWIHRYLGRSLIVAAMVTVGLAFRQPMVALSRGSQVAWYVVMGVLVLIYTVANIVTQVKSGHSTGLKQQRSQDTIVGGVNHDVEKEGPRPLE